MNYIEKFRKNNPSYYSFFILMPLFLSDILFDYLKNSYRTLNELEWNTVPSVNDWIRYYKDPTIISKKFQEIYLDYLKKNEIHAEALLMIVGYVYEQAKLDFKAFINSEFDCLSGSDRDYIYEQSKNIQYSEEHVNALNLELIEMIYNKLKTSPEGVFVTRVFIPCLFMFGMEPNKLFDKARSGNLKSLCNLLRIDKSIMHDKDIQDIVHQKSLDLDSKDFRKITNAFSSTITHNEFSKTKWLHSLGALIERVSKKLGKPLNRKEIADLLDGLAELGTGYRIHPDIKTPASLAKGIQRAIKDLS